jgi:hypothetical protein
MNDDVFFIKVQGIVLLVVLILCVGVITLGPAPSQSKPMIIPVNLTEVCHRGHWYVAQVQGGITNMLNDDGTPRKCTNE